MADESPKIEAVFNEVELVGTEFHLRFEDDDDDDGPITVIVDPLPGVTETITCTEMVCSSQEFALPVSTFETKFVLPPEARLADTTTVHLRRSKKR
jgi:hypothetical protein